MDIEELRKHPILTKERPLLLERSYALILEAVSDINYLLKDDSEIPYILFNIANCAFHEMKSEDDQMEFIEYAEDMIAMDRAFIEETKELDEKFEAFLEAERKRRKFKVYDNPQKS